MQEDFRIESSHMTYHLESLGNLLTKTEDGKYALSSLGEAAVSMMYHVEEPPKTALHPQLSFKRWKIVLAMLMVGLVLLSCLCYIQYKTLTQLSTQFLSLKEERELVQDVLKEVLGLENAVWTYEYAENGTVGNLSWPWGTTCSIYSLLDNSTLEMRISFPPPDQPRASLCALIMRMRPDVWNDSVTYLEWNDSLTYTSNETISYVVAFEVIRFISIANNGTYSAILPSRGRYYTTITSALDVRWNETEDYTINYTVALQIKDQKNYIPFFVESQGYGDP